MFSTKSFAFTTRNLNKSESCSLTNRGTKLLKIFSHNSLLPGKICEMTKNEATNFVHNFKKFYLEIMIQYIPFLINFLYVFVF